MAQVFPPSVGEMLYLDLRSSSAYVKEAEKLDSKISVEEAVRKKLKLRAWADSLGEYLYILSKRGLILRDRTYVINETADDL